MKIFMRVLMIAVFLAATALVTAEASNYAKKIEKKIESKAVTAETKVFAEQQKLEEEKSKEIENSEWDVTVIAKGTEASRAVKDKLIFSEGMVCLKSFQERGYGPTGYTLRVDPTVDGGTWETVQTGKEGSLNIRGDWRGTTMNGTAVEQVGEGENKKSSTFYFSSQEKKLLTPETAVTEPAAAPSPSIETDSTKALVSKEKV